jgi:type VI secretion system protein ImpK
MDTENKTVLLPFVGAENKLTDFVSTQRSEIASSNKNASMVDYTTSDAPRTFYDKNPIVSLSYPLFRTINAILTSYGSADIPKIRTELTSKMDNFIKKAAEMNLDNAQTLIARYLLCAHIDEMIGTTFWGKEHNWAKESLLSFYYQEAYGGEKFFIILNKLLASPANHINLLELMYICLSLGFEGKYRIMEKGRIDIEAIRDNLYKQIRNVRGRKSESIYVKKERMNKKHKVFYKASNTLILIIVTTVLIVINIALSLWLNDRQNEIIEIVNDQLTKIEQAKQPIR